jgi:Mrp family chromosome partitioning ATPase
MPGGRGKLPVLAEISGPVAGAEGAWSLRGQDFERLGAVCERLDGHRAVLVTGTDEPTRVLAAALAGATAALGRRTALLDCDLAQPRLAADLGLTQTPGLHEYLRWEATPGEVLQPLILAGPASAGASEPLVCISAGRGASDPRTLLGLQSFRHMAAKLRNAYELVILAGPGIDAGEESLPALAAQADALLAAVVSGQPSGREGRGLRDAIRKLPVEPLGAVVVKG